MPRIRNSNISYASVGMDVDEDTIAYGHASLGSVDSTTASFNSSSTDVSKEISKFNAMPTPSPSPTSSPTHTLSLPSPPKFEQFITLVPGPDGAKQKRGQQHGQGQQKRKHIAMTSPSHPRTNPDHIPRPRNAFILFRSHILSQLSTQSQPRSHPASAAINRNGTGGRANKAKQELAIQIPVQQQEASREIAKLWKSVDAETRAEFEEMAREEKRRHKELYPDYRYAPRKVQQQQQQSEAQGRARAVQALASTCVKSVKTKRARYEYDGDGNGDAPYVPGGRAKMHAHAQGRKASKRRAAAPLTPDTTPEPSPSPRLPQVGPVDFEEVEQEEINGGDAALEYREEDEEKDNASVLFGGISQSTPSPETKLYELPHPEFCFPPIVDANNNCQWDVDAPASRTSNPPMVDIDESCVPLLASSPYYTPTFTHVDRTRSDSISTNASPGPVANPHTKCTNAPCPSHSLAWIQQMADFDALLNSVNANGDSSPFLFTSTSLTKNTNEDEERDLIRRALRPFAPLWAFEDRKRMQGLGGLDDVLFFPPEVDVNEAVANAAGAQDFDPKTEMDLDATLAELVHLDMLTV